MHLSQEGLARIMRTSRPAIARYEGNPLKEIPGSADVALRLFYAARMTSDPIAKEIADLLMEIDELQHGSAPVAFHETEFGWLRTAAWSQRFVETRARFDVDLQLGKVWPI
jgi:hypothetical protein